MNQRDSDEEPERKKPTLEKNAVKADRQAETAHKGPNVDAECSDYNEQMAYALQGSLQTLYYDPRTWVGLDAAGLETLIHPHLLNPDEPVDYILLELANNRKLRTHSSRQRAT